MPRSPQDTPRVTATLAHANFLPLPSLAPGLRSSVRFKLTGTFCAIIPLSAGCFQQANSTVTSYYFLSIPQKWRLWASYTVNTQGMFRSQKCPLNTVQSSSVSSLTRQESCLRPWCTGPAYTHASKQHWLKGRNPCGPELK